jgi:hypothetical protein
MNDPMIPAAIVSAAKSPLAAQAIAARLRAESAEQSVVSPSRWEEASCYAMMHEREGKSTRQIAEECDTNQSTVSRFIRVVSRYRLNYEKPSFWLAYAEVTGEKETKAHVGHATGQSEWYTPAPILEAARSVLGGFDVDPASCQKAQQTVRAKEFFTKEDDGLSRPWRGRVWLNPPYSVELVGLFVEKLIGHLIAGDVPAAIMITNNSSDAKWFVKASAVAAAMWMPEGRIHFLDEDDNEGNPLQGQAVMYFGRDVRAFRRAWEPFKGSLWFNARWR